MALEHETHEGHLLHAEAINHLTVTTLKFVLVRTSEKEVQKNRTVIRQGAHAISTDEFKAVDTVK